MTHGQSLKDTYSIVSLSDWTELHGKTYVYMARTWHVALGYMQADHWRSFIGLFSRTRLHPSIDDVVQREEP